ncbi:hypothetical protein ACFFRR_004448 [Megaselia abdita]
MGPQTKRVAPVLKQPKDIEEVINSYLTPNSKLAILLDYDGTLAPIAANPNITSMTVEVEKALHKITSNPKVFAAVISGRGIVDVQNKVGIKNITYGGNHGIEIQNPDGSRKDYELPAEIQSNYTELVHDLRRQLAKNGAWVEDKRVSLTYHYRDTPADKIENQRLEAIRIIESHGFRANQAHFAIEAKPPVNWNKGEATKFILEQKFGKNYANEGNLKIVFAGDDTTDEDAMRVLQGIGRTFRIASDPKMETYADYRLPEQQLMTPLLQYIANIYKD